LDDRFNRREDAEQTLQAPVLATVPRFPRANRQGSALLMSHSDPHSLPSEFYRTLRTNLDFIASQRGARSLLVTSPSPFDGKTVTSANLSVALAEAGLRVILVSADLRRPALGPIFGYEAGEGLSTLLEGKTQDLWSLVVDPGIPNLRILPSGPVPSRPAELLASPRLPEILNALRDSSDYVIFDSPPTLLVADTATLASRVDATVLVIDPGRTRRSESIRARQQIERAGGTVIGVVLNSVESQATSYHYYAPTDGAEGNGADRAHTSKRSLFSRRS
jgi:non-specific protein-tyrosine kinase